MTNATWLRDLIEAEFDSSNDPIEGRGVIRQSLGESPNVKVVGDCSPRSRFQDVRRPTIFISGDSESQEARSLSYRHKKIDTRITVEIILSGGREKLFGTVSEDYGGYAGEVERIIDGVRVGPAPVDHPSVDMAEYDHVEFDQLSDEVERYGADLYGGEWTVTFINEAQSILQ